MNKSSSNYPFDKNETHKDNYRGNVNTKTTNINVLLNRVKLDQKKNFNKKLLFSTSIVLTISLIAVFVII